jgi:hypothetical protein
MHIISLQTRNLVTPAKTWWYIPTDRRCTTTVRVGFPSGDSPLEDPKRGSRSPEHVIESISTNPHRSGFLGDDFLSKGGSTKIVSASCKTSMQTSFYIVILVEVLLHFDRLAYFSFLAGLKIIIVDSQANIRHDFTSESCPLASTKE